MGVSFITLNVQPNDVMVTVNAQGGKHFGGLNASWSTQKTTGTGK